MNRIFSFFFFLYQCKVKINNKNNKKKVVENEVNICHDTYIHIKGTASVTVVNGLKVSCERKTKTKTKTKIYAGYHGIVHR